MRPRGRPPTPSARSSPTEPEGITEIGSVPDAPSAPSSMIAPRPNCFSMSAIAERTLLIFSEMVIFCLLGDGPSQPACRAIRRAPGSIVSEIDPKFGCRPNFGRTIRRSDEGAGELERLLQPFEIGAP